MKQMDVDEWVNKFIDKIHKSLRYHKIGLKFLFKTLDEDLDMDLSIKES